MNKSFTRTRSAKHKLVLALLKGFKNYFLIVSDGLDCHQIVMIDLFVFLNAGHYISL